MNFINDNSTQASIGSVTYTQSYSSTSKPNIVFNDSSTGIHNPSKDRVVINLHMCQH